ncbi:phosphoanhydride phosphohydrolase [Sphingomonas sp. Leaf357]|uniref:histidine-type phosphatase n=1 Tax=Sphingomonas sp. Leaf357 TaxID=1736350 RepID=UPI0006F3D999|nr:histidine-type phosphatase [Sphingomonas sp. Leaf357]KQS05025.1 phosphoanhydride phosphohydrolase [Sphingomonas sp. Leaf357]
MRWIGYFTAAMLVLGAGGAADARTPARANGLRVDRVVILMRHGVRPPTKAPPMPAGVAAEPWPTWPVAPGYLTPHGAEALKRLGAADRTRFIADGLLPKAGCRQNAVRIVADSDQRTIATATVWAAAIAPGCTVDIVHRPQDQPDTLFSPIDEGAVAFDAAQARAAVLADAGTGGIAAHERRLQPVLARLDAILCGPAKEACGLPREPSGLAPTKPDSRPKLAGVLDRASTVAQILLLEYADGKPMAEVGWGRATPGDIARASELHAVEFQLLARPLYVAARNMSGIGALMRRAISDTRSGAAAVTMVSGHDTNIASFAGLLDLHWRVPGLAADDPSPGGAIILERLVDSAGHRYVRAAYRSQTLDGIRTLTSTRPMYSIMPIKGCFALRTQGLCSAAAFDALLAARLEPVLATAK